MGSVDSEGFGHEDVWVDGVRLHVASMGNEPEHHARPLVVMLHGFPEFWWSWRHQMRALAAAGYRVVAPDQRGYNLSDKPEGPSAYGIERLALDIERLVRALGADKAHIVGHDWGAMIAWEVAQHHPEIVDKLVIMNVPHPLEMKRGLRTPKQTRKSWYIFFFQTPRLPERWIARDGFAVLRRMLRGSMPEAEIDRYVEAAARPGALTGMINYYRAAFRALVSGRIRPARVIEADTMVIWGEQDLFLDKAFARPPARFVPKLRFEPLPEASHWVQVHAKDEVSALLLDFLGAPRPSVRNAPGG